MKYVLILTLCSLVDGEFVCKSNNSSIQPYQFDKWHECILYGYKTSHNTLIKNYPVERINTEKLAVKFECRGVQVT
jgi:hypothetical protein